MTIQQKRKRQDNDWEKEFYKNGYPTEVIVIPSESPEPTNSSSTLSTTSSIAHHDILKTLILEPDPKRQKWNHHNNTNSSHQSQSSIGILAYHLFPSNNNNSNNNNSAYSSVTTVNKKSTHHEEQQQQSTTAKVANVTNTMPCDDKDGHYIVRPNDLLTSQYKIMRLLGQGTFGKVVECFDRVRRTFCAIKIIRAVPKYRDASKTEIRVLNTLKKHDPLNLNQCIHLIEWFDYRNHICMVFELLGVSLFEHLKSTHFKPLSISSIRRIAKQLLTSVAFLHDDLHLIHTDLKPENILLVNASSNQDSERLEIRLIDFGSATFEHDYHSSVVSTRHYRAPEIILGRGWSYPCDLWSVGCILVELFMGEALFQTHDNDEHLALMEAVLGPLPRSTVTWKLKVKKPKLEKMIPSTTQEPRCLLDLLKKLFIYDPSQRITAREALRHPFFF
ncbi:MAG: kinase-like domain-containing protein [Benjaminiella poitrasii]|nr:MAG: kinase-like domain-containing protein [Benjaminiella poitrasii]